MHGYYYMFASSLVFSRSFFELVSMVGRTEVICLPLILGNDFFVPILVEFFVTDWALFHRNYHMKPFGRHAKKFSPCIYKESTPNVQFGSMTNSTTRSPQCWTTLPTEQQTTAKPSKHAACKLDLIIVSGEWTKVIA